jgi:hypothetical protein
VDVKTHCLTVVIEARLRQDPTPDVEIKQSLIVKVENEIITDCAEVDIRHSVIKTVPAVALTAVAVFVILHPKSVYVAPPPNVDTLPVISNPEIPIEPVVSLIVIFPMILQGCLASPV